MKQLLFILIFALAKGFSQNSNDQQVLKTVIEFDKDSSFVYCQKSFGYENLLDILSKKDEHRRINFPDTLKLSHKEIRHLKRKIKKSEGYLFPPNLLPHSTLISYDSLAAYSNSVDKAMRKEMDAIHKTQDSVLIKKYYQNRINTRDWVHFLSKPIYFKNDTYCIMYYGKLCCFNHGVG